MTKFIFITGGVISGLGKGVIAASIGSLLRASDINRITIKKLDPYLNVDPGTLNPTEHGEVYVTEDGTEADLDLGYYERFANITTSKINSTSSGKLYTSLLEKERNGTFLGKTIQIVPHFTNEIIAFITHKSEDYDIIICEIGGCIGDIEAMPFYEAMRQLRNRIGRENMLFVHLTYLVYYPITKELKTKPTQNAIKSLREVGIFPNVLICRTEHSIPEDVHNKLALYADLDKKHIIEVKTFASSIYYTPIHLHQQALDVIISNHFKLNYKTNMIKWNELNFKLYNISKQTDPIKLAIVGKYVKLSDSYKSLNEAILHASIAINRRVKTIWIDAREDYDNNTKLFDNIDCVIVPGGFGNTAIENIINMIYTIRLRKIPMLGICLGMQLAVIEYARNAIGLEDCNSTEFDSNTSNPIVKIMRNNKQMGGTMRLGAHMVELKRDSKFASIYDTTLVYERHRHRYDVNPKYIKDLEENGMLVSGYNNELVETVELEGQFFVGCQYHPEYSSQPMEGHPLFIRLLEATKMV